MDGQTDKITIANTLRVKREREGRCNFQQRRLWVSKYHLYRKLSQNGRFLAPNLVFLEDDFWTQRKFLDRFFFWVDRSKMAKKYLLRVYLLSICWLALLNHQHVETRSRRHRFNGVAASEHSRFTVWQCLQDFITDKEVRGLKDWNPPQFNDLQTHCDRGLATDTAKYRVLLKSIFGPNFY